MADAEAPLALRFDAYELVEADARLTCDGAPVALAPKPFAVLCTLLRGAPRLVTKDALLDAVWGHRHVSESVLKTTISELRAALRDDARQPRYIETASRRGYRFIGGLQADPLAEGVAARSASSPAAQMPPDRAMARLIGRTDTLQALHAAWGEAGAGRRQIAWIAGEAGVGKSTVIEGFAAALGPGARRAHGQCVEQYGAGEPYLPVLEAIGALCRAEPDRVPLLRSVAPTWLLQLPWLGDDAERAALRRELAGASQGRMLREFGEWLERCTDAQPLLLVTEDLHWSDQATLNLIDHVARRRGPARLMWLASFRLAEVVADEHPLKALRHELRLHRHCREIVLDPFSEREVADYVERHALGGDAVPEGFVRSLHAHTDGLPLFVANVLDALQAQGAWPSDAEPASLPLPESLAGVIGKRIAALPPELCLLLEAASVCGVEFRVATLAEVLQREAGAVAEDCQALAQGEQWLGRSTVAALPDGRLDARHAFRHALYRHVFYQRQGALARAQLHRRVALAMEGLRAGGLPVAAGELALHHERGHDPLAALRSYAMAAESALRHFAPHEALALAAQARTLLPQCSDERLRDELEMALLGPQCVAATQRDGVAAPSTAALFERVLELGERLPGETTRAVEAGLGWVQFTRGDYAAAHAVGRRIEALAERRGDRMLVLAACNLHGAASMFEGELVAARAHFERGLAGLAEVAERLAAVPFIVDLGVALHARLGLVLAHLGFVAQAQSQVEAAGARAAAIGQPFAKMLATAFEAMLAMGLGHAQRVLELGERLQRGSLDHAYFEAASPARWLRGWALARLGDPVAGLALIDEACEMHAAQARSGGGAGGVLAHAAEAALLAGRPDEAQRRLDQAFGLARRFGERLFLPKMELVAARLALLRGDPAAAREALVRSASEAAAQQARWPELAARVGLCELPGAGDADRAALRQRLAELPEGHGEALALRARALAGAG